MYVAKYLIVKIILCELGHLMSVNIANTQNITQLELNIIMYFIYESS